MKEKILNGMLIIFIFVFILFLMMQTINATEYGYIDRNGYMYAAGYWWQDGVPHKRRTEWHKKHKRYYSYYDPVSVSYKDKNWRNTLIELAKQQKNHDAILKHDESEQAAWLEAIKELGLSGSLTSFPQFQQIQQVQYAQQGNTIYGYQQLAGYYINNNSLLHWNQANNLAKNAQNLSIVATKDFMAMIVQDNKQKADIARILAQGEKKESIEKVLDSKTIPDGAPIYKIVKDPKALMEVLRNKCGTCHNKEKSEGKLDVFNFLLFDIKKMEKLRERVTSPDPNKRMPKKGKPGSYSPGEPLPYKDLKTFF